MSNAESGPRNTLLFQLVATFLFYASLWFVRHQLVLHLNLDIPHAATAGLTLGWLYDVAAALLPLGIAYLVQGCLTVPARFIWFPIALFTWLAVVGNMMYFRFFEARLEWWVVTTHFEDLLVVKGIAGDLLQAWPTFVSFALFVAASIVNFFGKRPADSPSKPLWRRQAPVLAQGAVVLVLLLLVRQSPIWFKTNVHQGSILSDQILTVWWMDWTKQSKDLNKNVRSAPELHAGTLKNATTVLAEYRDYLEPTGGKPSGAKPFHAIQKDANWPLNYQFKPDPAVTRALRERLGLPVDKDINVLLFFVETFRAYEYMHPKIGPKILPRTRDVVEKHGIFFTQAYSSANITVNGQFSTMCSMIPNIIDPPTYMSAPQLRVKCIQEYLKDTGYRTVWLNSYFADYHNKKGFEQSHGMEQFYDQEDFKKLGVNEVLEGSWGGLADKPFLQASLKVLENVSKEGKPFFANLLTINTHAPWTVIKEGPLPVDIVRDTEEHQNYRAYLSRLRYVDEAMGDFFDAFFKSPISDNTVVVMLGDHGTWVRPHLPVDPVKTLEMWNRIPMAVISKNMKKPEQLHHPVHQADVAPTIAMLTGKAGETTWIGRSLFNETGSPWVVPSGKSVAYRTTNRACYPDKRQARMRCFDLTGGKDPLFSDLSELPEDPAQSGFFLRVIRANQQVIRLNLLSPTKKGT